MKRKPETYPSCLQRAGFLIVVVGGVVVLTWVIYTLATVLQGVLFPR